MKATEWFVSFRFFSFFFVGEFRFGIAIGTSIFAVPGEMMAGALATEALYFRPVCLLSVSAQEARSCHVCSALSLLVLALLSLGA